MKINVAGSVLFVLAVVMLLINATHVRAGVIAYWQMDEASSDRVMTLTDSAGSRDLDLQLGWSD